jgi:hypothetical protein
VTELLVDPDENKVRMLQVEHGGLFSIGATPVFIAVEAVQDVTPDEVRIDRSPARIVDAPRYDPELIDQEAFHAAPAATTGRGATGRDVAHSRRPAATHDERRVTDQRRRAPCPAPVDPAAPPADGRSRAERPARRPGRDTAEPVPAAP